MVTSVQQKATTDASRSRPTEHEEDGTQNLVADSNDGAFVTTSDHDACEVLCRCAHPSSRLFSSLVRTIGSSFGPRRIVSPSKSSLHLDIEGS